MKNNNTKELIKEQAINIIKSNTPINMRLLADKCQMGLGTLYYYYKSKDEIIIDIVDDYWSSFISTTNQLQLDNDINIAFEQLYFHLLNTFLLFEKTFLRELRLSTNTTKLDKRQNEESYFNYLKEIILKIIIERKTQINQEVFKNLTIEDLANFIFTCMINLIIHGDNDYTKLAYIIKKVVN